jgi:hypothetical protein
MEGDFFDLVSIGRLAKELLSQCAVFFLREHPGDDVATKKVDDNVEGKVGAARLEGQFAYVPRPDFVWSGGHQPWNRLGCRRSLGPSITVLLTTSEQSMHRADGAQIGAFLQELVINL